MDTVPDTYIEAVKKSLSIILDEQLDPALMDLYALLVIVRGGHTTWEDVHDAWSVWQNNIDMGHKSLIPFDQLTDEVKALDKKYADAIKQCAAEVNPRQINF